MRNGAVVVAMAMALALGACGGSSSDGSKKQEEPQKVEQKAEKQEQKVERKAEKQQEKVEEKKQTFSSDYADVEYQGTQDVAGNAMVTFMVTNKTDVTVMVTSEGLVVNDQFNIEALGGSQAPIAPGNSGMVPLTFGVQTQTTLSGTDDMETLSGELVVMDNQSFERLGTVPFSVSVK